jgi:hypothetical protein
MIYQENNSHKSNAIYSRKELEGKENIQEPLSEIDTLSILHETSGKKV